MSYDGRTAISLARLLFSGARYPSDRSDPVSVPQNIFWALVGYVGYAASQWLFLVVMAKSVSPAIVGQFSLGLAIASPIFVFSNLHLRGVLGTDARRRFQFADYLGLRLATTAAALMTTALVAVVSEYDFRIAAVIILVGAARASEAVSDIIYGLLQSQQKLDRMGKAMVLKGILSVVGVALVLRLTRTSIGAALALLVAWTATLLLFDIRSAHYAMRGSRPVCRLSPRWKIETMSELAWIALPLGVATTLASLNVSIPRYFVHHLVGEHSLGIFSALAYSAVAGATFIGALGQAITPRLAILYSHGDRRSYRRLLGLMALSALLVGLMCVAVSLVAGGPILRLLYEAEYSQHSELFTWILIAATIGYLSSVISHGLTAAGSFRSQMAAVAVAVVATVSGCYAWVPRFGATGAAWAMLASACASLGVGLIALMHVFRSKPASEGDVG